MKHNNCIDKEWTFQDSPNLATFTTKSIIDKHKKILYVVHDMDDGSWQFLPGTASL